jgi:SAM-dependent methyltransferase
MSQPTRDVNAHPSGPELDRLARQAPLLDPISRRILVRAGITPGMRVLDVGSGAGDASMLIATLVGHGGSVVGVDRSLQAVDAARQRAEARGLSNVSFRHGDFQDMVFDEPFDAVAGRHVLQFLADPAAALARLKSHLNPGGVIVFHEADWQGARSVPPAPIYDRCCALAERTIREMGGDTSMGAKLPAVFERAGLPSPSMRLEALIGAGPSAGERASLVADLVGTLLPDMERLGLVQPGEIDAGSLADRMTGEVLALGSTIIGRSEIGAWTRV